MVVHPERMASMLVLVGFYRDDQLYFCASVRARFVPASRRTLHTKLTPLQTEVCPFANLPEASAGRWVQGLTAAKMKNCIWIRPETVAQFRFWNGPQAITYAMQALWRFGMIKIHTPS